MLAAAKHPKTIKAFSIPFGIGSLLGLSGFERRAGPGTRTPAPWRQYVARRTGLTAPERMTDGAPAVFEPFESGYDPGRSIDQAIMATRDAIFPLHGLTSL